MSFSFSTVFSLTLIFALSAFAQEEVEKKKFPKEARAEAQELVKKLTKPGERVVVIVIPEKELGHLFLEDASKREKIESKVLLVDDQSVFKGKISPGGQSTLKSETPNLRVKKLENVSGTTNTIAGVENIAGTTRINPLTMDEGYVATNFYQRSLNNFGLVPRSTSTGNFKLDSNYTKVIYVPIDENGKLLESKKINAGLHLVNNHPVKFLEEAQGERYSVQAVGRSRYNVVNLQEKIGLGTPDPDAEFFSSSNSAVKTSPHRVEFSWAADDAMKAELKRLLTDVYGAVNSHSGEELYRALNTSMDTDQMFRFLAMNDIFKNGDISDEYFWFTEKDNRTGKTILRILPQDGDDLLKGVHMFPFHPEQVGLIAREKLHIGNDFLINLEDPLFRAIKNDPHLYSRYLKTYKLVAQRISSKQFLDQELGAVEKELRPYRTDADVLLRGATDEVGKVYDQDSFSKRIEFMRTEIEKNAKDALDKLDKEIAKVDKLIGDDARTAQIMCFKKNLAKLINK